MTAEAYPLQWPAGWPRTPQEAQGRSRFTTSYERAIRRLRDELRLLGATDCVISSDVPVRRDGMLYADAARRKIDNPGVAIYFRLKGKPMVMARDVYWTPHENITSLAHAIEHMRGLARHGGDFMMYQAFEGFTALLAPARGAILLGRFLWFGQYNRHRLGMNSSHFPVGVRCEEGEQVIGGQLFRGRCA